MQIYVLKNLDCATCAANIEKQLSQLEGVRFVAVNVASSTLLLDSNNPRKALAKIRELEPEVEVVEADAPSFGVSKSELLAHRVELLRIFVSALFLGAGLLFEKTLHATPFHLGEFLVFGIAYGVSGYRVIGAAIKNSIRGRLFDEQFLMTIATFGAIAIDEMPEAVAVMLFYVVGEFFQQLAVNRSRQSVRSLLALKPDYANLKCNGQLKQVPPESVAVGQTILVKAGEKIPLDGEVLEGSSFVDTSALTGESVPKRVRPGDMVLSGMINRSGVLSVKVTRPYRNSAIAKILELVETAASKKAETEKFITTFARYYTPVVVFSALGLAILPPLLIPGASFMTWLYRALVVLVISCPCALVISVPLGYFGGIGAAATKGILIKGSNFLDALNRLKVVVFDKTGTLTEGVFQVSQVVAYNGFSERQLLEYAALAEAHSNHPIAKAVLEAFARPVDLSRVKDTQEKPGYGIVARVDDQIVVVGNDRLLHREHISHPACQVHGTVVHVAVNHTYVGYILIDDQIKEDAVEAIRQLHAKHIQTVMLTGDARAAAESVAGALHIDRYVCDLLPGDKVNHLERIMAEYRPGNVAFVGDGINDAPVLARADIGIAMGALGSDVAIETADVVLMTDRPSKVVTAIEVAGKTRHIVWQNIVFALGVKFLFIGLGVAGLATMWEAVFGDMGVALVAIFNAIRVKK